jgi:hypothetical protein
MPDDGPDSGANPEGNRYLILLHHFVHLFNGRAFREAAGGIQDFGQKIDIARRDGAAAAKASAYVKSRFAGTGYDRLMQRQKGIDEHYPWNTKIGQGICGDQIFFIRIQRLSRGFAEIKYFSSSDR